MSFRAVTVTDQAETLVEAIFLWQQSPLLIQLAHKIASLRWEGLVPKKVDRVNSTRTYEMAGNRSFFP